MGRPDIVNKEMGIATQLQFEVLVADISARFLGMPPQDVDREIDAALRKILEFFDVDLSILWRIDPESNAAVLSHFQATDTIPVVPEKFNYGPFAPWLTARTA